jgi:hypothetical protein
MKKIGPLMALLVAFSYVMLLHLSGGPVMAVSGTISTDLPVYPIWGVGGTVKVTALNFAPNFTYYLWLKKPKQPVSYPLMIHFTVSGKGAPPTVSVTIASTDPPGTYTLSVSNSVEADTAETMVHFGVSGTDSQTYERTRTVTFEGGGYAANSTISLNLIAGNRTYRKFPVNVTTDANGNYVYSYKLADSDAVGTVRATLTGLAFDSHQDFSTSSTFSVQPAVIGVQPVGSLPAEVERTASVSTTYELSFPDGSPVTNASATVSIQSGTLTVSDEPLALANATTGKWIASWVPPPSTNTTLYHFTLDPTKLVDPYGNSGQGPPISSKEFQVTKARLLSIVETNATWERTQTAHVAISGNYHDGTIANVTQAAFNVTWSGQRQVALPSIRSGLNSTTDFKIPINATLGNWTVSYSVQDQWGNSVSGKLTILVVRAFPVFQDMTSSLVERTASLDVAARISYSDGTGWNKTVTSALSHGNETWPIALTVNSTTHVWSGSYYVVQNATLGPYNVTWSVSDPYGNGGDVNSSLVVVPAHITILPESSSATVVSFSNVDLPVIVTYPNGSSLPDRFGNVSFANVTASYQNSTGATFTLPLAYNDTSGIWHMYMAPQPGTFTFSFSAVDRFGNTGTATNVYKLTVKSAADILMQRLMIAGVLGTLIPLGVLIWAVATISTRRRKHKP